jgi:nucleoid-associated protein YgaU
MVQKSHAGSLGEALNPLVGRAALGAVVAAAALLGLGLLAEMLRRRHRARRVLALLDLTLPIGVRTAVVSLLALVATFTGPKPVGAADSVRGWLSQSSTSTTTTTRAVVATPDAVSEHASPPTPAPTGAVVLIPPVTIEHIDPAPPTVAPSPSVAPRPDAVPLPTTPSRSYVVKRGDCLWSIAAGVLGPGMPARSIDRGWRQIYAANRAAIGDNPNLIHIGLTLELPLLVAQP